MPSFDAGKIEGTADLDLTPFHRALDEAEARADAFEAHTYTARLGLDDSEGLRHLADMRDRLDEYEKRHYTAKVGVDAGTGRADIEALRREIDSLDKTVHVRVVTSGSGGTSSGGGSGGDLFSSLRSGLLGTAIALSPGAIPLAGVAGAGLLGTAGGLGVAGAGLGAFGLAAAPQVKTLTTDMQQLTAARTAYNKAVLEGSKSGEHDALAQQKNIFAGLNAEQKTALGGLIAFQGAYKSFQHDLQPTVLLVLQDVLTTASHLLPIVEPLAKATGTALDSIVRGFDHQISGGGLASFIQSLSKDVGPDLRLVATIIENLAADGGRLLLALQPLAMTVLPALDRATHGLGQGDGLTKFIGYAVKEAPVVGHALSEIIGLGGSLIRALAPLGGQVLVDVGNLARTLSHDLNSPAFAGFVHDLARTVPPLASGLGHLAGAGVTLLHDLGPVLPVVAGLAADAAHLVDALGPLPAVVLGVWTAWKGYTIISTALGAVRTFTATSIAQFAAVSAGAAGSAGTTTAVWESAAVTSATSFEGFAAAVNAQQASIANEAAAAAASTRAAWVSALGGVAAAIAALPVLNQISGGGVTDILHGNITGAGGDVINKYGLGGKPLDLSGIGSSVGTSLQSVTVNKTNANNLANSIYAAYQAQQAQKQADAAAKKVQSAGTVGALGAFGADPGVGGGGAAATAAANAQLVDYQRQISTGLASAIKRGAPAVQDETRKLRDTILTEFKNPAAARERQQALELLAQEAPKALKHAQANAQLAASQLGKTIADEISKSVQSGVPAVVHEIAKLQGEVIKKLSGQGDAAERKTLLADLQRELPILKGYATQYAALQTSLDADKTKLTALQQAQDSFRSSAYGSLSGGASLTSALSSGQGITNYLGNQLSMLQSFAGDLKQLKAAGIGNAALEMIVAAGPVTGGQIAKALLSSGTTGKASSLIDQIQGLAGTVADDETQEIYSPQLDDLNDEIKTLQDQIDTLTKTVAATAKATGTTVAQGLTGVGRTGVRLSKSPVPRRQHHITTKKG